MAFEDIRTGLVVAAYTVGGVSGLVVLTGIAIKVRQWQGRAIGNAGPAPREDWMLTDEEIDDATGQDEQELIVELIELGRDRLSEFEDQQSELMTLVESLNNALLYMVTVVDDPSTAVPGLVIDDIQWRIEAVTERLQLREEILANTDDIVHRLTTAIAEAEGGDTEYLVTLLPIVPEGTSDVA